MKSMHSKIFLLKTENIEQPVAYYLALHHWINSLDKGTDGGKAGTNKSTKHYGGD